MTSLQSRGAAAPHPICEMRPWSQDWHLSQVYTGFSMLSARHQIALRQRCVPAPEPDASKPQHLRNARVTHLWVIVNGSLQLYYDTHDGPEIDNQAAARADFYFKRSYSPGSIPPHLLAKVQPLGLNYAVYPDGLDYLEVRRAMAGLPSARKKAALLGKLALQGFDMQIVSGGYRPTVTTMYTRPGKEVPPRILFMARAWDPDDEADRERRHREQRAEINETRVRCVTLLREEFGAAFTGGFKHTPYAIEHYRHVLLDDPASASKRNYLALLAAHPICIATTGLHGSIGWKFGEYVAHSKAIVSERLSYFVPGDLSAGRHYLEFQTPEQCVAAAVTLFENAELRSMLMHANHEYYGQYLRPDMMIARTLEAALGAPIE